MMCALLPLLDCCYLLVCVPLQLVSFYFVVPFVAFTLLCVDGELVCAEGCTQVTGVMMAMMMTGRVLLVCALSVLWCGAGGFCEDLAPVVGGPSGPASDLKGLPEANESGTLVSGNSGTKTQLPQDEETRSRSTEESPPGEKEEKEEEKIKHVEKDNQAPGSNSVTEKELELTDQGDSRSQPVTGTPEGEVMTSLPDSLPGLGVQQEVLPDLLKNASDKSTTDDNPPSPS
ncbi:mucin-associated surface protein (MASP), putative, partial [Trypanosoma cruzi marinkellei]